MSVAILLDRETEAQRGEWTNLNRISVEGGAEFEYRQCEARTRSLSGPKKRTRGRGCREKDLC